MSSPHGCKCFRTTRISFQMNDAPTRLEVFPNELLLHLFTYVSPVELQTSWTGLNQRFDAIVRSTPISFELNDTAANTMSRLKYFSPQVVYLSIRVECRTLNLCRFPQLRSLVIDAKLAAAIVDTIQPKVLPRLTRLTFGNRHALKECFRTVCSQMSSGEEQRIPWLKVYHLPELPSSFPLCQQSFAHIHTLILDRVQPWAVHHLLSIHGLLRRLKVTIVNWSANYVSSIPSDLSSGVGHGDLVHFDVTMNAFNKLDDFYPLLSRLPRLQHLHVESDSLTLADFARLAFELNSKMPWLPRFTCYFRQTYVKCMVNVHCLSPFFHGLRCVKVDWGDGWHFYCVTTNVV